MPNGFDAYYSSVLTTLKTKDKQLVDAYNEQQLRLKNLSTPPEASTWEKMSKGMLTMAWPVLGFPFSLFGAQKHVVTEDVARTSEVNNISALMQRNSDELARTRQLTGAVQLLYYDKSASFDEFKAKFAGEKSVLQLDDYNVLQELYNRRATRYEVIPAEPTPSGVPPLQPTLKQLEQPPRPTPTGLDLMTTEEILKSLRAPAMPTLPTGLTGEQAKDIFQYTDLDKFLDDNQKEIIKQMHDVYDTAEAIKSGIAQLEVPKLTLFEILKAVVSQPALAAYDLAVALSDRFFRPLTGMVMAYGAFAHDVITRGRYTDKESWITKQIDKSLAEGDDLWTAFGSIYEAEGVPNWNVGTKLAAEILLDPTNLLGFTFVSRIALKVPLAGKYLAATNTCWIRIWDDVFYGLIKAFKKAPKTPSQVAVGMTDEAKTALRMAMVDATGERNPAMWTIEQLRKVAEDSRNFAIAHPELANTSNAARFGKWQMSHRTISPEEVSDWLRKLDVSPGTPVEPAIQTVSEINLAYDSMKITGKGTGYTAAETADRVLKSLVVPNTTKNLDVIGKLLNNRQKADLKVIEAIFKGKDVNSVIKTFAATLDNNLNEMLRSPVTAHTVKSARMASFLAKIDDNVKAGIVGALDKHLTVPISRQYLYFPAIGPGNVLETVYRAALRGHNVMPGMIHTNPVRMAQWEWAHLSNAPADIMEAQVRAILAVAPEPGESLLKAGAGELAPLVDRLTPPGVIRDVEMFGAKWWKKVPRPLKSLKSLYDYTSELGFKGLVEYTRKAYNEALGVLAPAQFKAAKETSKTLKNLGLKVPAQELAERQEMARIAALIGPDAVRSLKSTPTDFMIERIGLAVDDILSHHPNISEPIKNLIKQRAVIRTLDDVPEFMNDVRATLKDTELINSTYAANMYEEFAKGLTTAPIKTAEQLDFVLRTLGDMSGTHPDNLSTFASILQKRADELTTAVARDETYFEGWQRLSKYMSRVDDSVQQMIDTTKASLDTMKDLDPLKRGGIESLLNVLGEKVKLNNATRLAESDLFAKQIAKWGKKPRTDKFWNTIRPLRQAIWDDHWKLHLELGKDEALALARLSTTPQPALPKFTGDLLISHIAYTFQKSGDDFVSGLLRGDTSNFMSRQAFIDTVAAKAEAVASQAGTTAANAGFTPEAISKCYDDIFKALGLDPTTVTEITPKMLELDDIEKSLQYLKISSGVDPTDVAKYNQWLDNLAARTDTTVPLGTQVKAMEEARKMRILDYPDYTDLNAGDMIMKKIYPFFTYESNRPFWVPRTMLQKPGLLNAWGKYMSVTDIGYIPIPFTDYEFNPFIGQVFMGGFRRFFKRDYPEYANQYPWLSEPLDWFSRGGFYPGPIVAAALAIFGTSTKRRPDFGEIPAPWVTTGINVLQSIAPDNPLVQTITEVIFPLRWRRYLAGLYLDNMGLEGGRIVAKLNEGLALDEFEQLAYDDATRKMAIFQAANTQTGGMIRYRPDKLNAVYAAATKIIEEMRPGMTPEVQEWIRNHSGITGKNMNFYMQLDPLEQKILYEASGLRDWAGTVNPVLPPVQQEAFNRLLLFQAECQDIRDEAMTTGYGDFPSFGKLDTMLQNYFRSIYDPTVDKSKTITPERWINNTGQLKGALVAAYDVIGGTELYKNVPRTLEERLALYKKYGIVLFVHPTKELLWEFNEIKPEMIEDPDLGWSTDWTTYFKRKEAILAAVDDEDKQRFIENMQMNWTPMYKLFWSVNRDYLKKYKMVREIVMSEYSSEDQSIIKRIAVAPLAEREALMATLDESGKKLYNQFNTKVRTVRRNLRLIDPQLDAWLLIWGVVDSPATEQGRKAYETITRDLATGDLSGYIQ